MTAIDIKFLNKITGEDFEFEKELFDIFIESCQKNISRMQDAMQRNEDDAWYMASHSLKGASASIGAFPLSKLFEYAQTHCEESFEQKSEMLDQIAKEFDLVKEFISQKTNHS